MNKKIFLILGLLVPVLGIGIWCFSINTSGTERVNAVVVSENSTPKNATYIIEGDPITLIDGFSEQEIPESISKITTQYFGNEVRLDLNDDEREDVVFLLTQSMGGSGTFFFVVAALNTENGWEGSKAFFLGDRIAPQTIEISHNNSHDNVLVVNYADRNRDEPMTIQPSVGKSVWLKLDTKTLQFETVSSGLKNNADSTVFTLDMKPWYWVKASYNNDTEIVPNTPDVFTLTFENDGSFSATTDCNSMGGTYEVVENKIMFGPLMATKMFCQDSQEQVFAGLFPEIDSFFFSPQGELIFEFKYDSGVVIFR